MMNPLLRSALAALIVAFALAAQSGIPDAPMGVAAGDATGAIDADGDASAPFSTIVQGGLPAIFYSISTELTVGGGGSAPTVCTWRIQATRKRSSDATLVAADWFDVAVTDPATGDPFSCLAASSSRAVSVAFKPFPTVRCVATDFTGGSNFSLACYFHGGG